MHNIAVSKNPVDIKMKESIEKYHGMDMSAPPPGPMPVKMVYKNSLVKTAGMLRIV